MEDGEAEEPETEGIVERNAGEVGGGCSFGVDGILPALGFDRRFYTTRGKMI